MRHTFARIAEAAVLSFGLGGLASAANIIYPIQNYSADQNGATLSGSITTDGTIGPLAISDILSWTWTITPSGGAPFTYASGDLGAGIHLEGTVVASPSEITISAVGIENGIVLFDTLNGVPQLNYFRTPASGFYDGETDHLAIWSTPDPAMGGHDPWIIAALTVPEPSTLALLGIAAACVAVRERRRPSRRARQPVA
jgi:PEP-CTERM motif